MTFDERAHRVRVESQGVFEDDLLVEAARTGWLRSGDADPLTRLLAQLHHCASGTCPCPSRDECGVRGLHPDPRR